MPLDLNKRGNTRTTAVSFFETNEKNEQEEFFFNVEHLRITHEVGEKLAQIERDIREEQRFYWENEKKLKKEQLNLPRNIIVEQLTYLVKHMDILQDGKELKPTRENFTSLDTAITGAILETITDTVIPEKKK